MISNSRRKSAPPFELNAPTTFSMTTTGTGRPRRASPSIRVQNGRKVPLRSPARPRPLPASERSWQGNDAQASAAPEIVNDKFRRCSKIAAIGRRLLGADIVRQQAGPALAKSQARQAAAGEKLIKSQPIHRH